MRSIKSYLLTPHKNLLHAFTTKEGGFSQIPFTGNNLAYHVQDQIEIVDKNHAELAKYLNYSQNSLIRMNQVHGDNIVEITKDNKHVDIPSCDALITNLINTPLMVMVADCLPILLYDPIKKVIAAVHAGRAGVFTELIPKSIQQMQTNYQSEPENIQVILGPSIHNCCYEVGEEIKDEAYDKAYSYAITEKNDRYYLDLISIVKQQLKTANIQTNNVEISKLCTACNTRLFYSYRAEKKCGRFAGIIMLK